MSKNEDDFDSREEMDANINLIKSAPDLLEAAEAVLAVMPGGLNDTISAAVWRLHIAVKEAKGSLS